MDWGWRKGSGVREVMDWRKGRGCEGNGGVRLEEGKRV